MRKSSQVSVCSYRSPCNELAYTESPLDCKEIKPVNSNGNQPRIFIGRTGTEAEAPILWLPDEKSQLIKKDPDAGKIEGRRRSG